MGLASAWPRAWWWWSGWTGWRERAGPPAGPRRPGPRRPGPRRPGPRRPGPRRPGPRRPGPRRPGPRRPGPGQFQVRPDDRLVRGGVVVEQAVRAFGVLPTAALVGDAGRGAGGRL